MVLPDTTIGREVFFSSTGTDGFTFKTVPYQIASATPMAGPEAEPLSGAFLPTMECLQHMALLIHRVPGTRIFSFALLQAMEQMMKES